MLYFCGKEFDRLYYHAALQDVYIKRLKASLEPKKAAKRKVVKNGLNDTLVRIEDIKKASDELQVKIAASEAREAVNKGAAVPAVVTKDESKAQDTIVISQIGCSASVVREMRKLAVFWELENGLFQPPFFYCEGGCQCPSQ